MKALIAAAALLLLAATSPGWEWSLPAGVAPPIVPADNMMSAAKVELGRRLFYDADLSPMARSPVRVATNRNAALPTATQREPASMG